MSFKDIPGRIFLDTCSVNFIFDHGDVIFEGERPFAAMSKRDMNDVMSFRGLFQTGSRASWQLAVSPLVYDEVQKIPKQDRRASVERWFLQLWEYWMTIVDEQQLRIPTLGDRSQTRLSEPYPEILKVLPDRNDRVLIAHALAYKCDCFCTRDYRTILKMKHQLTSLRIRILSPTELWNTVKPYASLWY